MKELVFLLIIQHWMSCFNQYQLFLCSASLPLITSVSWQLDAGVPEKISLVSRDEKSVLVVTYSDLKRCFDSTFQELQAAASGSL